LAKFSKNIKIIIIQIRKKIPKNSQISLLRKQTKLVPSPQQLYQVGQDG